jgi:hypothetical protein
VANSQREKGFDILIQYIKDRISVSRWLPIAAARVRSWVWSSGICGGQSAETQ